jgi:hypothetical protein
MVSI